MKTKLTIALSAIMIVGAAGLAACAPSAASVDEAAEAESSESAVMTNEDGTAMMADFTDRSTGLFPDVQENAKYLNSGNRGCASCHTDLFDADKNNGTTVHITPYVGLKDGSYRADCAVCHNGMTGTAGNILSEGIHTMHYSSELFNEGNGNCWSCHVTSTDEDGNIELMLFEDVMYESVWGGYPDNATDFTEKWVKDRGWETGYMSGISVDGDAQLSVEFDQATSEEEDQFYIQNYKHLDGNDAYADIDPSTWTLEVTGAEKSGSYTLDDIKAMPETSKAATQWCLVVGYNTALVNNTPFKGVLLEDFVEAVGVPEECNTMTYHAIDDWEGVLPGNAGSLQSYIDNGAMLVYNSWGHDLTIEQGAPLVLFVPGTGGTVSIKYLDGLDFSVTENPATIDVIAPAFPNDQMVLDLNSSWFVGDGVKAKVGEQFTIEGASFNWSFGTMDYPISAVEFSLDYGRTWQTFETPDGFDPDQWVHYTVNWTPEEAGTYIMKVRCVAEDGTVQEQASSVIVTVEE